MAQQTRQSLMALYMRLYGSFAGKVESIPAGPDIVDAVTQVYLSGQVKSQVHVDGAELADVYLSGAEAHQVK